MSRPRHLLAGPCDPAGTRRSRRLLAALSVTVACAGCGASSAAAPATPTGSAVLSGGSTRTPPSTTPPSLTPPSLTPPTAVPAPQSTAGLLGSRPATLDALRAELALRPVSVQVPGVSGPAPVEAHTTDPVSGGFDLPKGAAVVAWWASGSAPGGQGSVVLAGHVSYDGQTGPFTRLSTVPVGSEVVVTSADGSAHRYSVQTVRSAPKTALDRGELFRTDGPPALVLVTCGGAYDASTHTFASNVVVTATPAA